MEMEPVAAQMSRGQLQAGIVEAELFQQTQCVVGNLAVHRRLETDRSCLKILVETVDVEMNTVRVCWQLHPGVIWVVHWLAVFLQIDDTMSWEICLELDLYNFD